MYSFNFYIIKNEIYTYKSKIIAMILYVSFLVIVLDMRKW